MQTSPDLVHLDLLLAKIATLSGYITISCVDSFWHVELELATSEGPPILTIITKSDRTLEVALRKVIEYINEG